MQDKPEHIKRIIAYCEKHKLYVKDKYSPNDPSLMKYLVDWSTKVTFERRAEEEDTLTAEAVIEDDETYKEVKKAFDAGSKAMGPGVGQGAKKALVP